MKKIVFLLITFAFFSCEKDKQQIIENTDIPLIIEVLGDGKTYLVYTYTDKNLLCEEKSKFHYTKHTYNDRNLLLKSEFYIAYDREGDNTAPSDVSMVSGDSGGPSFYTKDSKLYVIGIHSRGYAQTYGPSIETNVMKYAKWINTQISNPQNSYPTPTPAPFVNEKKYNTVWQECAQFNVDTSDKTASNCQTKAPQCGYQPQCNVCYPSLALNNTDLKDCFNILEKLKSFSTPTSIYKYYLPIIRKE